MPINHTWPSPYDGTDHETWSCLTDFRFNLATGTILLTYWRYSDRASAYAGKPPIKVEQIVVEGADYARVLADNDATFGAVKQAADAYATTMANFAGGTEVD